MEDQTKKLFEEALNIAHELRLRMSSLDDAESLHAAVAIQNNRILLDIHKCGEFIEHNF